MEYEDYGIQKSMIIIMLAVFLISIASVSASDVNDTAIASDQTTVEISKNEEIILNQDIEQTNNEEIISQANPGTFTELQGLINLATDGSTLKLNKSYEYDDGFSSEGISIAKSLTIDGQGYKIDAKQKSRIFQVTSENVILKNIIFINAKIEGDGGAVHFGGSGTVENCNFTNNSATSAGGAIHMASGTVENCNFNNNTAGFGGAIRFYNNGTSTNCNFTNNLALNNGGVIFFSNQGNVTYCNFTNNSDFKDGGAVYFYRNGDVTNCNFINNSASNRGGAIYFSSSGLTDTVTNCNFTGNNANTGSAIYFYRYYSTDVLTVSNSIFLNNRANADALEVNKNDNNITITFTGGNNLLNAIYSEYNAEVSFTNVTYWGSKGIANTGNSTIEPSRSNRAAGQNITVGIVVNDELVLNEVKVTDENGTIVLNINTGENYFIGVRHDADSYYTEAEKSISNNTKFNVNVTSQTTTNKTVNITAKSNIYSEFMPGQLLFILPNGNEINAL